ncbi:MAG: AAA family ATPase [Clostridia bacterium]|nr:AAA family ATPase [Clostridia bacterium]
MIAYKFEAGQSIQLTTNSMFYKNVYESTLLSASNNTLEISTPYYKGLHVPLNVGFILNLKISTYQGICEFTTEVIDRNIGRHSLVVKLPSAFNSERTDSIENRRISGENFCRFITITSGKGGVGKTSFIINYAITLARKGKKVVVLDADLGMANVDVLMKVNSRYNIIDVIDGSKSIQEVIIEAPGGIKLVPGGSGIQDLANLTPPQFYRITAGFSFLEQNFDYVLIDTGAGLSKNVTNFIYAADETVILTTPEPHAITDAYSIIKVILDKSRDIHLKLIINKCETSQEGEAVLSRITSVVRNFLNYNIVPCGYIPESKYVSRSIKEQVPLCISYPTCDIARSLETIVNSEIGSSLRDTPASTVTGFVNKFKSFFGKSS